MKYQLHCPKCHYEFSYDNGYYDKNIERLGNEIYSLNKQLAEHKLLPWPEQKRITDWRLRAKKLLAEKQEELAGLKAIRKVADQQIKRAEYDLLLKLIREKYGEKEYKDMVEKVLQELEAYKVSGLMWHEYSRSNSKANVTSINKI